MKKTTMRKLSLLLALCALLMLACACGGGEEKPVAGTCTLCVNCASALDYMDAIDPAKQPLIPADGLILPETELSFYEGETALDLLVRVCREQKLQLENDGGYIKAIGNLYEFDAGETSGWGFKVNGEWPPVSCESYSLADGDTVEFHYFCTYEELM